MASWLSLFLAIVMAVGHGVIEAGDPIHVGGTSGSAYPIMLPGGRAIAYYMAGDIWLVNLDNHERRAVIARPSWESRFSPSPDGSIILFTSERVAGGRTIVCMTRLDGVEIGCLPPLADITYVCGYSHGPAGIHSSYVVWSRMLVSAPRSAWSQVLLEPG